MSIVDVPYETFTEYILPHITFKEVGALALMCKDFKAFCDDNETWKVLYLRTVDWKVTDKSVHIDTREVNQRFHRSYFGFYCGCCEQSLTTAINRDAAVTINMGRLHDYNHPYHNQPQQVLDDREAFKGVFIEEWTKFNRHHHLSTVNLCQKASHYKTETLDIPGCRNYKSFKKETLKKELTKAKRPIGETDKALKKIDGKMEHIRRNIAFYQEALEKQEAAHADVSALKVKRVRLVDRLTGAVEALKPKPKKPKRIRKKEKKAA